MAQGQQIFVYRPRVEIYIQSFEKGEEIDVSDDIVSGSIDLVTNNESTLSFVLNNAFKKYDGVFSPMDKVICYMTRIERKRVFTGYLNNAHYRSLYPGKCSFQASDVVKLIRYTNWDPGLDSSVDLFYKHLVGGGGGQNRPFDLEGGIGYLILELLTLVGGWRPEDVMIMPFPREVISQFAAKGVYSQEEYNRKASERKKYTDQVKKYLSKLLGTGGAGGTGNSAWNPNGKAEQWKDLINKYAEMYQVPAALMAALIEAESDGNPNAINGSIELYSGEQARGLFQFLPSTFRSVVERHNIDLGGKSLEDAIFDPEINIHAGAAHMRATLDSAGGDFNSDIFAGQWSSVRGSKFQEAYTRYSSVDFSTQNPGASAPGAAGISVGVQSGGSTESNRASQIISNALQFVGQPYVWGGGHPGLSSPGGVDCSGLINSALKMAGVDYSAVSQTYAAEVGEHLPFNGDLKPGTLIFPNDPTHVAMVIGGGNFIEAAAEGIPVRILPLAGNESRFDYGGVHPNIGTTDQAPTGGTTGNTGGNSEQGKMLRYAFNTAYLLPSILPESGLFVGDRALINDESLLLTITQLCKASMRSYMSTPDGRFLAFFPDYFGVVNKSPFFVLEDIEIKDFNIDWNDKNLFTHVFCAGDMQGGWSGGQIDEIFAWMNTTGIVSIEQKGIMDILVNKDTTNDSKYAPKNFLNRFGARPITEGPLKFIGDQSLEYFYALHQFMTYWSKQYQSQVEISFMPELFPGTRVKVASHDLLVYVERVTHMFDNVTGFSTTLTVSMPQSEGGENKDLPLAQDSLKAEQTWTEQRIAILRSQNLI